MPTSPSPPGGATSGDDGVRTLHSGAGGEGVIGRGFTASAELGALDESGSIKSALGVLSVNGGYHFRQRKAYRVDPFVTGGYTLLFRSGSANLGNFGGGLNWWFSSRFGLKVEFRDHVWSAENIHFLGIRFGVTIRGGG